MVQFRFLMGAEVGLEPHDLRVMSPTSYQLLYPATKYTIWNCDEFPEIRVILAVARAM